MLKTLLKIFIFLIITTLTFASDFDNFKSEFSTENFYDSVNSDFDTYQKEINKEFEIYKQVVNEEFKKYKAEISKKWKSPKVSTNKQYVEYSNDFKKRKIVNFENNTIEIEVKINQNKSDNELINTASKELKNILTETTNQAWHNDTLSQNIEKKLKKKTKYHLSSKIGNEKVVGDLFFDGEPTQEEINKKVLALLSSGNLKLVKETNNKAVLKVKVKLPKKPHLKKAYKLKPFVEKYSKKLKLPKALIFSIIHNESSFNPLARSYVPAYGLMQIVPKTAGKDATNYLYGKPKLLLPSYLYESENNIKVGTAYMYVLYYRYMRKIKNPQSRIYCTIAAYNTGSTNVARAFVKTKRMSDASKVINTKTPQQVYDILVKNLPYKETRNYVKKVTKTMNEYSSF